eukprot:13629231-Ditylum_brightwellii.AAC.1
MDCMQMGDILAEAATKTTDRDTAVEALNEGKVWMTMRELPTRDTFNKEFNIKQETWNNKPRVIIFVELKLTWKWT